MKTVMTLFVCYFYVSAFCQKLTLVNVEELRSFSGSWDYCKLELKPIGDDVRNFTFYKINEIKSATDNKGINLKPENQEENKYKPVTENLTINLQKASRSATTFSIDGSVSFYKPTEANGGIVKIGGFKGKPQINLAPKTAPFKLFYYDKITLSKMNSIDEQTRYDNIQKLPEEEQGFASEVSSLASGMKYYNEEDLDNMLFFAFSGDNSVILSMEFENAKGEKLSPNSTSIANSVHTYYFGEKIEPNMKIILNVESKKAIKIVPFVLVGLDLP